MKTCISNNILRLSAVCLLYRVITSFSYAADGCPNDEQIQKVRKCFAARTYLQVARSNQILDEPKIKLLADEQLKGQDECISTHLEIEGVVMEYYKISTADLKTAIKSISKDSEIDGEFLRVMNILGQELHKAETWMAEHGDSDAMVSFADKLIRTKTEQKARLGINLLKQAASLGNRSAMDHLTLLFANGWYLPKDKSRAYMWAVISHKECIPPLSGDSFVSGLTASDRSIGDELVNKCLSSGLNNCW